jgi:hypothetical protein
LPKIHSGLLMSKEVVFEAPFQFTPTIKKAEIITKTSRPIPINFFIYTPPAMLRYRIYSITLKSFAFNTKIVYNYQLYLNNRVKTAYITITAAKY